MNSINKYSVLGKSRINKTGFLSIGSGSPIYLVWNVSEDCAGSGAFNVYTSTGVGDELDVGVIVYSDSELLFPMTGSFYYYIPSQDNPAQMNPDITGEILTYSPCNNEWSGFESCGGGSLTLYTKYSDTVLIVGTPLYSNSGLNSSYTSSLFSYEGLSYNVTDGVITAINECLTEFTAYDNCSLSNILGGYFCVNPLSIEIGTRVYLDQNSVTEISTGSFVYSGNIYTYVNETGVTAIEACST